MIYGRMTYADALKNIAHLSALGHYEIYLDEDGEVPWDKAVRVESGGGYRLNGPCGIYVIAEEAGLTFKWSIDFEQRAANGASVSMFDRDKLRDVVMKLPPAARASFAEFLHKEVMPGLRKTTAEVRAALNKQLDSEDCVRGLIEFARGEKEAA